jgi:phosphogluconate dehydratase
VTAPLNAVLKDVTARIEKRSAATRARYLEMIANARIDGPHRKVLSCGNLAHGFAASGEDKARSADMVWPNVGIVTAYNDMLSAHQPMQPYPDAIKAALRKVGAIGQVAGGVPAMCDGVTQGQPGMELSLFSRDVIAMATAVSLSHNMFDAAICLGTCDKIVPGQLIGALRFGHLPTLFLPAGPMRSGLPNAEKARIRQLYAEGKVGPRQASGCGKRQLSQPGHLHLLRHGELQSDADGDHGIAYAGLRLRQSGHGSARRDDHRHRAARRQDHRSGRGLPPAGRSHRCARHRQRHCRPARHRRVDQPHHPPDRDRARGGLIINWDDFDALSKVTPLLTRIYPNGQADVNHFHAAGGMAFLIRELLDAGLLHGDVLTLGADSLADLRHRALPRRRSADLARAAAKPAPIRKCCAPVARPISADGGLRVLKGPLGRSVIKISAVKPEHRRVEAPAIVFNDQAELMARFQAGELERDFVAVVRFQGPKANGMPELHKLTPPLGAFRTRASRSRWSPTGACPAPPAKCPPPSISARKRSLAAHRQDSRRRYHPPRRRSGHARHAGRGAEWDAREQATGGPIRQ